MANPRPPMNARADPDEEDDPIPIEVLESIQRTEKQVLDLRDQNLRESTLHELAQKRDTYPNLALLLWDSFGTITIFLQEIIAVYPLLSPPNLTPAQSNRVCDALALLQCVAAHPQTKIPFLGAQMPQYLYPFLNSDCKAKPFEYVRLTSLGVIGALVKVDNTDVVRFLLSTEIIPLCFRAMEVGSELSKAVGTFILHRILLDNMGLDYMCVTAERFFALGRVLSNMVAERPSIRLLKHIIGCYLRLSDDGRARDSLRNSLPPLLKDAMYISCLRDDPITRSWLQQLLHNVHGPPPPPVGLHPM